MSLETGTLKVSVINGKGLAPRDKNGKSDPFCSIGVVNGRGRISREVKTKVVKRSLDPTWNEDFEFGVDDTSQGLKVVCWDWDRIGKDFLGEFLVPPSEVAKCAGAEVRSTFTLAERTEKKKSTKAEPISGTITLALEYIPGVVCTKHQEADDDEDDDEEQTSSGTVTPRKKGSSSSNKRFQKAFGLSKGENPRHEYVCTGENKSSGEMIPGHVFLTKNNLCFSDVEKSKLRKAVFIRKFPFRDVISTALVEGAFELSVSSEDGVTVFAFYCDNASAVHAKIEEYRERRQSVSLDLAQSSPQQLDIPKKEKSKRSRSSKRLSGAFDKAAAAEKTPPPASPLAAATAPSARNSGTFTRRGSLSLGTSTSVDTETGEDDSIGEDFDDDDETGFAATDDEELRLRLLDATQESAAKKAGEVKLEVKYTPPTPTEKGVLNVLVMECRNLDSKDKNGLSDPYCKVVTGKKIKRTKMVKKCLNPVFNEAVGFVLTEYPPPKVVRVEVWDWDKLSADDFIGGADVDLAKLVPNKKETGWHPLYSESNKARQLRKKEQVKERREEKKMQKELRKMKNDPLSQWDNEAELRILEEQKVHSEKKRAVWNDDAELKKTAQRRSFCYEKSLRENSNDKPKFLRKREPIVSGDSLDPKVLKQMLMAVFVLMLVMAIGAVFDQDL
eukprot:TRINITY_DN2676_c0_g2_i1.p1 TRINITY_DN2676_c0_g2~~TRINITY_DN2676_c0_g2_i1.p1  ORF type:complete len:685 (+),score=232.37 TRINITY_DN2676_c0_g2_i1:43-2055(+)